MSLLLSKARPLPFPIRRVYCVGRNYAEHRKEMGGSDRDRPFFFMKPYDAVHQTKNLPYPKNTAQLSYEGELVVIVGPSATIYGITVGVDLTKRDIQSESKKAGRPWESSKSFDLSALIGEIVPVSELHREVEASILTVTLNGTIAQQAPVSDMIWSIPELFTELEKQDFSVKCGDIIFTGTPAGVGQLKVGDHCQVSLERDDVPHLDFTVV